MQGKVITALIVRHAEVNSEHGEDNPSLSPAGLKRAQSLLHIIGEAGITSIYTTQLCRSVQTAEPLATHLGLDINEISDVNKLVKQVLTKQDDEVIFIVGHTDTIPEIIKQLGGNLLDPITASEFDNMYITTFYKPENTDQNLLSNVVRLKY